MGGDEGAGIGVKEQPLAFARTLSAPVSGCQLGQREARHLDLGLQAERHDLGIFLGRGLAVHLAVQIVAPRAGSTEVSTNFGSQIDLSGAASPIQANSVVSYEWSWFKTGADPATRKSMAVGQNAIWNIVGTEICTPENVGSTQDVTLILDVVDTVIGNPALTTTGTAQSNIHISCQKLT